MCGGDIYCPGLRHRPEPRLAVPDCHHGLLTSVGVAGVPAASLVAIVVILAAAGLPAEGIGLILAVDRILDMCRTTVNIFSDSCGAVIIARTEGEQGVLEKVPAS